VSLLCTAEYRLETTEKLQAYVPDQYELGNQSSDFSIFSSLFLSHLMFPKTVKIPRINFPSTSPCTFPEFLCSDSLVYRLNTACFSSGLYDS
jgi:hypothetical protein